MSSEPGSVAPSASRLPRLASPGKPTSSIPLPKSILSQSSAHNSSLPSTTTSSLKRKAPSSPAAVPAKRTAAPARSSSGSTASTTSASASAGLRQSQRGAGSFAPTSSISTRRGPRAGSDTETARPVKRVVSGPAGTRTANVGAATGAVGTTRSRPPLTASATVASGSRTASALGRSVGVGARPRGISPGIGERPSAIGSGMASAAQVKNQNGRLENVEKMVGGFKDLLEMERSKIAGLQTAQTDLQTLLLNTQNTEREARRDLSSASEEMAALRASHAREVDELERQVARKDREKRGLEEELRDRSDELSRERETVRELKQSLATQTTQHLTLSAQLTASQTQLTVLQAEVERATLSVSAMRAELEVGRQKAIEVEDSAEAKVRQVKEECEERIAQVEEELRTAETIRRKLHNQVQELKGNIRVFARVRPSLPHEQDSPEGLAEIAYGDERTAAETGQSHITVTSRSESAMGKEREQVLAFTFDKVFQPRADQKEVFEEISMLAQSVLDGYNVCIFAYGQTGSGKSWTMEGGQNEQDAGMIPRAIDMIFEVSGHLRDRGWKYHMEGTFLEVYNEVINDLLGSGQFDTKKHEIKLDKDGKVSVTDIVSIPLTNPRQVSTLLDRARSRRAVAATLMNERSSRSHSVFSLKVKGVNPLTDEKCEGTLNLVDLAGSERLASSGAGENKDRLKETININKSLSALADVIGALGQGQQGGHVPYRNSTLTRLLQTSLSGSSKTLMMCNLSPLAAHLGETVCSLRFATKVNSTVVGSAKKQVTK